MAEMNATTAELLQQMIDIKKGIRTSISNKGVTSVGGMVTYPTAIDSIAQTIIGTEIDFTRAGWTKSDSDRVNQQESAYINNALNYANLMWGVYGDMNNWESRYNYLINPFYNDTNLIIAPSIQTNEKVGNLIYDVSSGRACGLFEGCVNLKYVTNLDFASATDLNNVFKDCESLAYLGELNTSGATYMGSMFEGCNSLTTIPQLDTSNVTYMTEMFKDCTSLTTVPQLDTSNVTYMNNMFSGCSSLTAIPQLNTSKVKGMDQMFANCSNLTTIPQLDTSSVTSAGGMFIECKNLETIPYLDFHNVTLAENLTYVSGENTKLKDIGGFGGLKTSITCFIGNAPNVTVMSLLNIIGGLAEVENEQLNFGPTNLAKLTSDQIAVATNKGWTLF